MNQFFYQLICKASKMTHSDDFRKRNVSVETAFTRNRKLSFPIIITLILNLLTRTAQIELDDFFSEVLENETESVTKQAFFKARKNVKPDAFKELFFMTRDMILEHKKIRKYRGYRIFAIDGSELRLDKTKENEDVFKPRGHSSPNKTNAKISVLYDVISHNIIDSQIGSLEVNEREYAKRSLDYFSNICNEKDIVIFDRGYPSKNMIALMSDMKCKYLMRLQDSTFKNVKENTENDFQITITNDKKEYSARVVRVALDSGETETLITNLSEEEFKTDDFKSLYFMRWGVETVYDTLKNKLLIEKFAGRSTIAILQEYYAMMFVLNCMAAMTLTINKKLSAIKKHCKYRYRANLNLMIGYFKHRLSAMILFKDKTVFICKSLISLCLKQPVPFIAGRSFLRPSSSHQRKVFCPKYSI